MRHDTGPTLVFDGDCGFCTATADWVARHSPAEVVPWQRLDLAEVGLTEAQVSAAAYWLADDSLPLAGARAVAAALRSCGGGWGALGWLIDLTPVRPLATLGYRLVARYRGHLPGSTPACRR